MTTKIQELSIAYKLDQERKALLDTSNRNPLINFRRQRAAGVQVVGVPCKELYDRLVISEQSYSLRHDPSADEETPNADVLYDYSPSYSRPIRNASKNTLQTPYPSLELNRRLRRTHARAREAIEETGVNVLFIALGMLEWYEADQSDIKHLAPLIVVPVSLDRINARGQFRIGYSGEDFGTNLSLSEKLREEFRLRLPELPDDPSEIHVDEYFNTVADLVANQSNWTVDKTSIELSFFSFTKLLMYRDLDSENWPGDKQPGCHPVVKSLLGDGFRKDTSQAIAGSIKPEELDRKYEPGKPAAVMDADSSQLLAIMEAGAGNNLVVEGPPGTGKSQTIANILAEAIERGNKVLFVSEKMAALEVVKRRMDNIGLGVACLELHSNKARKTDLIANIRDTWELSQPTSHNTNSIAREIAEDRERLNEYAFHVNTPIRDSGITPIRAYGEIMRIESEFPDVNHCELTVHGTDLWDEETASKKFRLIEDLQEIIREYGNPSENPLHYSRTDSRPLPRQFRSVNREYSKFQQIILELEKNTKELSTKLG